jgi:DNA repair protein RecN (Recombination protein N)
LNELVEANLKSGEQEVLEDDFEKLNNVETIKESLDKSLAVANEEQIGVLNNLKEIKASLQKIAGFSTDYNLLLDRVTSVAIEFDDISDELSRCSDKLINDPVQLDRIGQQLQLIYNLQKKHQVSTVDELLEIQVQLENSVFELGNLEAEIEKLTQAIQRKVELLDNQATTINDKRLEAIPILTQKLIVILDTLGMPNVRFDIQVKQSDTYYPNGKDEI